MKKYLNFKTLLILIVLAVILFLINNSLSSRKNQKIASSNLIKNTTQDSSQKKVESKVSPKVESSKKSEILHEPIVQEIHVPILMYHHIIYFPESQTTNLDGLYVYTHNFEAQMAYLKLNGFNVISLNNLYQGLKGLKKLPEKSIVLTFDDGYDNFYSDAYPILRKYNFPATVFVISGKVGTAGYMNWRQIGKISQNNISIGAHTVNHPRLTSLSLNAAALEIEKSKQDIEFAISLKVKFFSYPAGAYNTNLFQPLKDNRFLMAVTTEGGVVKNNANLFSLPRKRVDGKYVGLYGINHFISLLK